MSNVNKEKEILDSRERKKRAEGRSRMRAGQREMKSEVQIRQESMCACTCGACVRADRHIKQARVTDRDGGDRLVCRQTEQC